MTLAGALHSKLARPTHSRPEDPPASPYRARGGAARMTRGSWWKYVINGHGTDGTSVGVVAKLSPSGHLVVLTAYREE